MSVCVCVWTIQSSEIFAKMTLTYVCDIHSRFAFARSFFFFVFGSRKMSLPCVMCRTLVFVLSLFCSHSIVIYANCHQKPQLFPSNVMKFVPVWIAVCAHTVHDFAHTHTHMNICVLLMFMNMILFMRRTMSCHPYNNTRTQRSPFWWNARDRREGNIAQLVVNFLAHSLRMCMMCMGLLSSVAWKLLRFNRTKIYGQVWCDVIEFKFEFNANIVTKCVRTDTLWQ